MFQLDSASLGGMKLTISYVDAALRGLCPFSAEER
jgi:hypothetical protein